MKDETVYEGKVTEAEPRSTKFDFKMAAVSAVLMGAMCSVMYLTGFTKNGWAGWKPGPGWRNDVITPTLGMGLLGGLYGALHDSHKSHIARKNETISHLQNEIAKRDAKLDAVREVV